MKKTVSEILFNYGIQIKETKKDDYITLCPFHSDKNPSFSIHKDKGIYHCWSCHEKGNLVTLVKNIENITYDEAKKKINGDEKLSKIFSIKNKYVKEKKKNNILDLKYYEYKYLLELLFFRDDTNVKLRKKLSEIKDEEEFKPILDVQYNLRGRKAGFNFLMKREILKGIFQIIESYDCDTYNQDDYEDLKYEKLFQMLKYYNFEKEVEIINDLLNNKKYKKIIEEEKLRSKIRYDTYKIYKKICIFK